MKNKITLLTFLLTITLSSVYSQEYYWSSERKIPLNQNKEILVVQANQESETEFLLTKEKNIKSWRRLNSKSILIRPSDINPLVLNQIGDISKNSIPAFKSTSGYEMIPTGEIIFEPKENISFDEINELSGNQLLASKQKYGYFVAFVKDYTKILEISNLIYESGKVKYCHPNFIAEIEKYQNDPLYPDQYYLNNTGQFGGTVGIDINAPEAWAIAQCQNSVRVAVLDDGVENHLDISGRVLQGFTPTNPTGFGAPNAGSAHGQACAGIIAASRDNNEGIAGISPCTDIIPINIFEGNPSTVQVAEAIDWAWDDGAAAVLSNSWGYPADGVFFDNIAQAIKRAIENGRGGDGAVVVFASGNSNNTFNGVTFPANLPDVITVGAIRNTGAIWDYSSRGPEMDLVAPSGNTNLLGDVRTTDRPGGNGYETGDYTSRFGGTSAACPQVAGVASLLLSINPNLTGQEVANILINSATDMGAAGFDNTFGFGRLNAFTAVQAAQGVTISGPEVVCNSPISTFSLQNGGSNVTWQFSSNLQKISSNSNSITVQANGEGEGFIEAILSTGTVRKEVWVGQAKITKTTFGSCYEPNYRISATYPDAALEFKVYHNGTTTYHSGSAHYEFSSDSYNLQDGESTTVYISIRNNCGWSQSYPVLIYKPTLCDCGYNDPSCGGSGGPPSPLSNSLSSNTILHPNPADQTLFVNSNSLVVENKKDTVFQIELFDLNGRLFFITTTKEVNHKMDVSMLKDGLYILHLSNGKKRVIEKLIIKH